MSRLQTTSGLSVEREIMAVARRLLTGEVPLLEGCHRIERLRWQLPNADDPFFDTFVAVASETEDLPIGQQRQYWNHEALKRKDKEALDYANRVRSTVLDAAKEVIARYQSLDQDPNSQKKMT